MAVHIAPDVTNRMLLNIWNFSICMCNKICSFKSIMRLTKKQQNCAQRWVRVFI